jgi:hypothetical protein
VTDPDSRLLHTRRGRVQGYNAQAVTTVEQVIVAAERPGTLAADSGYWSIANLTELPNAPQLLIPPPKHGRHGKPRKDGKPSQFNSDGLRAAMTAKLQSEDGKACYAKRKETVEPVFGKIKDGRGARRLLRRGLAACEAECKLLCGTHNLLKLWRHTRIARSRAADNPLTPVEQHAGTCQRPDLAQPFLTGRGSRLLKYFRTAAHSKIRLRPSLPTSGGKAGSVSWSWRTRSLLIEVASPSATTRRAISA